MAALARNARMQVQVSDDDLRHAYRACRLVNTTFEATMQNPALSLTIRRLAECNVRRHLRMLEQQRLDRKRAQANDHLDQ